MSGHWSDSTRRSRLPGDWQRRICPAVKARDGHRCTWVDNGERCTGPADDVDHIVPPHLGGSDAPQNLRSLCRQHHKAKSAAEGAAMRWRYREKRAAEQHPGVIAK
jgi:5-methylcytosine-specific restriction protein A